jgi:hypothetical protein
VEQKTGDQPSREHNPGMLVEGLKPPDERGDEGGEGESFAQVEKW